MLTNLQKAALAAEFRNLDATLAAEYIIRLGLDPGFGNFKIALAVWGKILVDYIASVVGIGKTDAGLLDNLPGSRHKRLAKPDMVEFGGVTYLTGNNVHSFTRRIAQRLDFERLVDGPELRALLYTVLGRLLGGGQHQVAFMVGLPVEIIQNRELAQQMLRQLQGWLVGAHNFTVNGQAMTITVTAVKVIAQPAGAYFAWSLDANGQWTQTKEVLKSPVAVVDGGYNTVDIYTLKDGNVDMRYCGGEKSGMRRANELLRANIQEQEVRPYVRLTHLK